MLLSSPCGCDGLVSIYHVMCSLSGLNSFICGETYISQQYEFVICWIQVRRLFDCLLKIGLIVAPRVFVLKIRRKYISTPIHNNLLKADQLQSLHEIATLWLKSVLKNSDFHPKSCATQRVENFPLDSPIKLHSPEFNDLAGIVCRQRLRDTNWLHSSNFLPIKKRGISSENAASLISHEWMSATQKWVKIGGIDEHNGHDMRHLSSIFFTSSGNNLKVNNLPSVCASEETHHSSTFI